MADPRMIPEPEQDKDGTQPNKPVKSKSPQYPPPLPSDLPEIPARRRDERRTASGKPKRGELVPAEKRVPMYVEVEPPLAPRKPHPDAPSRSGCYIPAWSILLTLIFVFACAFTMLAIVIALGGDAEPGGQPVIQVVTPMQTPTSPLDALLTTPTPTLQSVGEAGNQFFDLMGPTLQPVIFTATPMGISVGVSVSVDVDGGLNVRPEPGVSNIERFRANYGEIFTVIGGPENVNGFTWWLLQDPSNSNRGGWAAGEFLAVVPSS
jgi:hypothetical protein